MSYDIALADKIRVTLLKNSALKIEEKKMFRGLTFMVNDKMCISVSGENMMCRFDPGKHDMVAEKNGFKPMIMREKELKGYCYVAPIGFASKKDFDFWVNLCLDFNTKANPSKKKRDQKQNLKNNSK
jgi:hypothetical protein